MDEEGSPAWKDSLKLNSQKVERISLQRRQKKWLVRWKNTNKQELSVPGSLRADLCFHPPPCTWRLTSWLGSFALGWCQSLHLLCPYRIVAIHVSYFWSFVFDSLPGFIFSVYMLAFKLPKDSSDYMACFTPLHRKQHSVVVKSQKIWVQILVLPLPSVLFTLSVLWFSHL